MPTPFDWKGAATFGHWSFSGPSRFGYSLLQTLLTCIILGLIGWFIKMCIDIVSTPSTSTTVVVGSKLEGFNKMIGNDDAVSTTKSTATEVSGPAMFFGFIFSVAAWVWTVSFSAACYEHWRNLVPDNEEQKNKESGIEAKKTA